MSSDEGTARPPKATGSRWGSRPAQVLRRMGLLLILALLILLDRQDARLRRELGERVQLTKAEFHSAAILLASQ